MGLSLQADNIVSMSHVFLSFLIASIILIAIFRNDIIMGATVIQKSDATILPSSNVLSLTVTIAIMIISWMIFSAVPSIAAKAVHTSPSPTNSGITLESSHVGLIIDVCVLGIWLLAFTVFSTYFIAFSSNYSHIFEPEAQFRSSIRAYFSQIGTVAFSSILLVFFEPWAQLLARIFPSLHCSKFFAHVLPISLAQAAYSGSSLSTSASEYAALATAVPGLPRLLFSVNIVFAFVSCSISIFCGLIMWPHLMHAAQGDVDITSVAIPFTLTMLLACIVSRCVLLVLSSSVDAHLVYCANEIRSGGASPKRSFELYQLLVEENNTSTTTSVKPESKQISPESAKRQQPAATTNQQQSRLEADEQDDFQQRGVELSSGGPLDKKAKIKSAMAETVGVALEAEAGLNVAEEQINKLMSQLSTPSSNANAGNGNVSAKTDGEN
jgi:hypothetical protein